MNVMRQMNDNKEKVPYTSRLLHSVAVLAVAVTVGSLDQVSKWIAGSSLVPERAVEIIPGFLNLQLRANPHGAFGLFANLPDEMRLPVLLALSVIAIFAIVTFSIRTLGWSMAISVSLGLILGGALSNLADRAFRGEVMDFIDVYIAKVGHWPTFNLADMTITVGSLLLVAALYKSWRRRAAEESEP